MKKVALKNEKGLVKNCKVGFSWTMFFLGLIVPLYRGDFKGALKIWLLSGITLGIYTFIAIFKYNNEYIKTLIENGYTPSSELDRQILVDRKIIVA